MTDGWEREEQRLPDGRRRICYRLGCHDRSVKPEVTVITGAAALSRAVCRSVAVMVDRSGAGDPSERDVYQGRAGCREVWQAISQQFAVGLKNALFVEDTAAAFVHAAKLIRSGSQPFHADMESGGTVYLPAFPDDNWRFQEVPLCTGGLGNWRVDRASMEAQLAPLKPASRGKRCS